MCKVEALLTEVETKIVCLERTWRDPAAEQLEKADGIFGAMPLLAELIVDIPAEFAAVGFDDAGEILKNDLAARLLADRGNLQLLMKGSLLHPRRDLDTAIDGMPDEFRNEAAKAKASLRAATATAAPFETQRTRRGERAPAQTPNEYDAWRAATETVQCPHGVVAYWLSEASFPKVKAIALKIAAFNTSSSDVERLFSETRTAFDFNRGAILTEHMSTRMCIKMNSRMIRRYGLEM